MNNNIKRQWNKILEEERKEKKWLNEINQKEKVDTDAIQWKKNNERGDSFKKGNEATKEEKEKTRKEVLENLTEDKKERKDHPEKFMKTEKYIKH